MTLHTSFGNFLLHTNVDYYGTPNMEMDRVDSDGNTRVDADGNTRIVLDAGSALMLHTQVSNYILHTEVE
jgi:hypothetical protein